uniref:Uncharacterized protein n=1 Tax=Burkholderia sp. (strain CCGE1003) TaxID=640512 RepID=E1TI42_BURSG
MIYFEADDDGHFRSDLKEKTISEGNAGQGADAADGTEVGLSAEERILTNPLFGEPVIKTAPAREAYYALRLRLLSGMSGFTVLGKSEMGPGETLKVLCQYLKQEYPQLPVYEHVVWRCSSPTQSRVLSALLSSAGHGILRGSDEDRMKRLLNMQEEKALVGGSPSSVWMIHNAELIDVWTCKALLDMRNALILRGIRLFLVHGANVDPFLRRVSSLVPKVGQNELRTLFGDSHTLRGVSGLEEYAGILMEIDTRKIGAESAVTWSQALLPEAYRGGFRLKNQAPALHAAITERNLEGEFPIRALFEVIRSVMSMSARHDSPDLEIPQDVWARAVAVVMGIGSSYLQGSSTSRASSHAR